MFKTIVILFLLFSTPLIKAQDLVFKTPSLGFNVGLHAAFGTHVQRLGCAFNFYYLANHLQANSEIRVYYNFKNLGPNLKYTELVLAQGLSYSWGAVRTFYNPFLGATGNQSKFQNNMAFAYTAYFNRRGTTQQTGQVAVQLNSFDLIIENDLFARPALDRFRTGAILLQYQYRQYWQGGLACALWTGQMGHKAPCNAEKIRSACYMDTSNAVFANTSHGLLYAQGRYAFNYSQILEARAGVDAEQIRNAVQNHFFHDMRFLPHKWRKYKNCHIPMLDTKGNAYLYLENQKIRKAKPLLNVSSNSGTFY